MMNCCKLDPLYCATHYKDVLDKLKKQRQTKTNEILALLRTSAQMMQHEDYVEFMRNVGLIEYIIKDLEGEKDG